MANNYYRKEEKVPKNISDYSSYKELARFKKARSPQTLVFLTNDPDEWFIDVIFYKTKSGEVAHDDYIIEKDVNNWMSWQENLGWERV